jgi:hypothetical protein
MCPIGFLMLGSTLQDLPNDSPAACRSACRRRQASLYTRDPYRRTILARTRPVLVGHAVELATAQPPPTTTARSKPTPRLAQHRLRQLRAPGSQLRQTTSRAWTQRATTPTPAIPAVRLPAPPPRSTTSLRPDTADAATHRHRTPTPDADTGRRTADTWTLRRPHRTLDTGRMDSQAWTLVARTGHRTPDTGHWTPDAGRGRGQGDEGATGIRTSWATTPSDRTLGRPTVFLWTAPGALDSPCSSAVRPPSSARYRLAGSCLAAPPGSSGASAHCCPHVRDRGA